MKPLNISKIRLDPSQNDISIVLITQNKLRHKRFIVRFNEEFRYKISNVIIYEKNINKYLSVNNNKLDKLVFILKKISAIRFLLIFRKIHSIYKTFFINRRFRKDMIKSEQRLNHSFQNKFNKLKLTFSNVSNFDEVYSIIHKNKPTFLISLGGPLIPTKILNIVSGFSINQHAGMSPLFKGNYTTFWPLYRRDILKIGTTIHLTKSGADSGGIIAQERISLDQTDTPGSIFHKTVISGTELMIKVMKKLIEGKEVECIEQQPLEGNTYLSKDFTTHHKSFIYNDFDKSFLINELNNIYKI